MINRSIFQKTLYLPFCYLCHSCYHNMLTQNEHKLFGLFRIQIGNALQPTKVKHESDMCDNRIGIIILCRQRQVITKELY